MKKDVPPCYFCSAPTHFFLKKNEYRIFKCPSCGLLRTEFTERFDTFVKSFYSKGYFTGDPRCSSFIDYKNDKALILKNMRQYLFGIKKCATGKTLLDVGCAYGFFVEETLKHGFDAYGIDPSDYAISKAPNAIKDRVCAKSASEASFGDKKFDVITLFDVIEHLADPLSDLGHLTKLLAPDGIVAIATGDTGSVAARVLKKRWTFYIPPQHLFFFNKHTMTTLLEKSGLVPVMWYRIGKWVSLGYVLHLAANDSGVALASWLFPIAKKLGLLDFPLYIPLGDNMVVIAKRK